MHVLDMEPYMFSETNITGVNSKYVVTTLYVIMNESF